MGLVPSRMSTRIQNLHEQPPHFSPTPHSHNPTPCRVLWDLWDSMGNPTKCRVGVLWELWEAAPRKASSGTNPTK